MRKNNIVVVDYKMSNIFSIKNIFNYLGYEITISNLPHDIKSADALVLPGIGAFKEAMNNLNELGLIDPIKKFIYSGKPFLGICLGLQLLFSKSYEFDMCPGLDILKGDVMPFPESLMGKRLKTPNIGWNRLIENFDWSNSPLRTIRNSEFVYFLHSYFVKPQDDQYNLSMTDYDGFRFCSSVNKDNIFATQFHPEKSGSVGMIILKNWLNTIKV